MNNPFKTHRTLLVALRYGPYLLLRHIWIQVVVVLLMFGAGTLVFNHYQGLDWLTALLASVSTITTIGIYAPNIVAMPNTEKILLVIIFIVSVGAAASLVQGTVTAVFRKEMFVNEINELTARGLKGHVIVMGYGYLGRYVTTRLGELGLDWVVIARDEAQAQLARKSGGTALAAPVTHAFEALKQAGAENARAIVVTFDDDGDNMLAVMMAKKVNPNVRVITIVNNKDVADGAKAAQADVVMAPFEIVGQMLAASTVSDEVAGAFTTERMKGRGIAEFEIKREMKLTDLERVCPVMLVVRKGKIVSGVDKDFTVGPGDTVYVLTDHESLVAFRALNDEGRA